MGSGDFRAALELVNRIEERFDLSFEGRRIFYGKRTVAVAEDAIRWAFFICALDQQAVGGQLVDVAVVW